MHNYMQEKNEIIKWEIREVSQIFVAVICVSVTYCTKRISNIWIFSVSQFINQLYGLQHTQKTH